MRDLRKSLTSRTHHRIDLLVIFRSCVQPLDPHLWRFDETVNNVNPSSAHEGHAINISESRIKRSYTSVQYQCKPLPKSACTWMCVNKISQGNRSRLPSHLCRFSTALHNSHSRWFLYSTQTLELQSSSYNSHGYLRSQFCHGL